MRNSMFFSSRDSVLQDKIAARVEERNSWETWRKHSPGEVMGFLSKRGFSLPSIPTQKELDIEFPVQPLDWNYLQSAGDNHQNMLVTWMGHATCLVQMDGFCILTDPVFSYRCAPTQLAGPARYRPTPCTIQEMVDNLHLDVIMISHNHYDHLDYDSVKNLAKFSPNPLLFVVPLGLKSWLQHNISKIEDRHTIVELDWHESYTLEKSTTDEKKNQLTITGLPMQHWSSRHGYDRDATLWCGFSMRSTKTHKSALFAGDTGYFDGLKDIGERYGPFDVGMIPIGAYAPREFMKPQHNDPCDAVKMYQAIQARRGVPIHWGTFQLTKENYLEPRERLKQSMLDANLQPKDFDSWLIGETVVIESEI
mmetsp:Transcript_11661/g.18048  ORF Transcript_11661/g.18048 Transcript_11661/m.18048 type:complete len:365 (-) Transcript_11661:317-1411(-)